MVAKEVSETELTGAGVKIGGSVAGLVGTGMLITGKFEHGPWFELIIRS